VKSSAKLTALCGLLILAGLLSSGCDNHDGSEWQRLVCEVSSVNEGAPLVSAYINVGGDGVAGGGDDFTPIDTVPVMFRARPYSNLVTLPEDGTYSWFHITRYDLNWENTPGSGVDLTPHNIEGGAMDARIPVDADGEGSVLVVGVDMKNADWFVDLGNGNIGSFQANAHLTFYGRESGNANEVSLDGGLRVHFIPAVVEN